MPFLLLQQNSKYLTFVNNLLCCLNLTVCQSILTKEEECLKAKNIFLVKVRDRRIHLPTTTT